MPDEHELTFSGVILDDPASLARALVVRDRAAWVLGRAIDSLEVCQAEQAILTRAMLRLGTPLNTREALGDVD